MRTNKIDLNINKIKIQHSLQNKQQSEKNIKLNNNLHQKSNDYYKTGVSILKNALHH